MLVRRGLDGEGGVRTMGVRSAETWSGNGSRAWRWDLRATAREDLRALFILAIPRAIVLPQTRPTAFLVGDIVAGVLRGWLDGQHAAGMDRGDERLTCFPEETHRWHGRCTSQLRCARLQLMHADAT